ncbi:MAG: site-specific integrase [Alphaproteobacteria bacterium]|nr:site-specific integrase [Alphaproteobacteria bacterium]
MKGHIRPRGPGAWELKFDVQSENGQRKTRYVTFHGGKRDAQKKLTELLDRVNKGSFIDPLKTTLSEFLDRWEGWAATQVSAKTLERYKDLLTHHVRPHLRGRPVQKLRTVDFAELYGKLQSPKPDGAGLAPRTVGHVHRLLHRVFGHAVKWSVIGANPVTAAEPPRVQRREIDILDPDQIRAVLHALRGHRLYPVVVIALATGMRRGEIVALRWADIDLDGGKIRVERSLEETKAGLAFKEPKTKAGRRTVGIPPSVAAELRSHRRRQQEQRLALGLGGAAADDLVLPRPDGGVWPPDRLSSNWAKAVRSMKLPRVTFHALRHTHVSQLIAAGLDVVTVSRRIGHSNPTITLSVYAHLFGNTDDRAAQAVETALAGVLAG